MEPFAASLAAPEPAEAPQPVDPIAPRRSALHRMFIGPFGLRAGWGVLLYVAMVASVIFGIRGVQLLVRHQQQQRIIAQGGPAAPAKPAHKAASSEPDKMGTMIMVESIAFAVLLLLSWIMARIERRRVSSYGLGGAHSLRRFLAGTGWGLAAMALLVGMLRGFHYLSFDARLDFGMAILGWGAVQLFAFLLVGLVEEYVFRGYIQFTLTRGMVSLGNLISPTHARSIGFWIAAVLTSALFLLAHTGNSGENKMGLASVFLAGVLFLVALWRTGSLWWAIGFHMAWDWSQSFLYGVPDSGGLMQGRLFATHPMGNALLSGGTVGPEGSVLLIPVLVLAILVLVFLTKPSPQPPLELPPSKKRKPALAGDAQASPETQPLIA